MNKKTRSTKSEKWHHTCNSVETAWTNEQRVAVTSYGRNKNHDDEITKNQEKANNSPSYRCAVIKNKYKRIQKIENLAKSAQIGLACVQFYKIKLPHVRKRHSEYELSRGSCHMNWFLRKRRPKNLKTKRSLKKPKKIKIKKNGLILNFKGIIRLCKTLWYQFPSATIKFSSRKLIPQQKH